MTNARARKIIAAACDGASVPACAAAGGVTPNTLKSWLRRKDHPAFTIFQGHYADAVTYATLATLKVIADGVASDPKHAVRISRQPLHRELEYAAALSSVGP